MRRERLSYAILPGDIDGRKDDTTDDGAAFPEAILPRIVLNGSRSHLRRHRLIFLL